MPWGQIFLFILTTVISRLIAPKPTAPPPPEVQDAEVPQATEGSPIPVVFGTRMVRGPNTVWYGDLRTTPIQSEGSGGKK